MGKRFILCEGNGCDRRLCFSHHLWCSIVCFVEHFALVLRLIVIIIYLSLVIGDEHNVGMDVNKEGAGKTPEKGGTGTVEADLADLSSFPFKGNG